MPSRSWEGNFSEVFLRNRAPFFYLDLRKGRAVKQSLLSFLIPREHVIRSLAPCISLPPKGREETAGLLSDLLPLKRQDFRNFLPCHPCSRERILEASPRSTVLCGMVMLLHSGFSGNEIKQCCRCPSVGVSMVSPKLF